MRGVGASIKSAPRRPHSKPRLHSRSGQINPSIRLRAHEMVRNGSSDMIDPCRSCARSGWIRHAERFANERVGPKERGEAGWDQAGDRVRGRKLAEPHFVRGCRRETGSPIRKISHCRWTRAGVARISIHPSAAIWMVHNRRSSSRRSATCKTTSRERVLPSTAAPACRSRPPASKQRRTRPRRRRIRADAIHVHGG